VIQEWVVDFLRPTVDIDGRWPWEKAAERKSPFKLPDAVRSAKYLVNGTYPGPTLRCAENDTLEITVINDLFSEATTIHWHGVHMPGTPYMDGARGVTQGPIRPGENFTYRFSAWPPGTHYYHSHMDAVQGARGLKGAIVIDRTNDPIKTMFGYDEDRVVFVSDEWKDPSVCLKVEGAMPGNDVCADIRHASFNGAYGNGTTSFPFPLIGVDAGKCYRFRFIMAGATPRTFKSGWPVIT
jgi:FtsP/CotA-like multicopper oxidase with cupredoxin domain